MDIKKYKLTIELPIEVCTKLKDKESINFLESLDILTEDRWDEGRYPFYDEMLGVSLHHLLQEVVRASVIKHFDNLYPNESINYVSEYGEGSVNKAYHLTDKYLKNNDVNVYAAPITNLKIEEVKND